MFLITCKKNANKIIIKKNNELVSKTYRFAFKSRNASIMWSRSNNENTVSFTAELLIAFPQKNLHKMPKRTNFFLFHLTKEPVTLQYNFKQINRARHGRRGIIFGASSPASRLN